MPKQQITGASTPIRIACGVCAVMLLWTLGACGGAKSPEAASTPPAPNPATDTTAPALSITSPTVSGSYSTTSATVSLSGTASDNVGVASVTWSNLGNNTNGSASGTGTWSIASISLAQGANQVTVTAHDAAGNTKGATLTVNYNPNPADTTAPTVSITSPTASATYSTTSAAVSLSGTASDNVGVASVTWSNLGNGTNGSASGTGVWSIASIALAQGPNQITVTAHDAAGNTKGATLTVTSTPGGPVSLSGSVDSSLINRSSGTNTVYIYSGTVTPSAGAIPVATAPVTQDNGACTFSYQFVSLPAGVYTLAFSSDATTFRGTAALTLPTTPIHDFPPARRLQVGPTRNFTVPSAAIAAAQAGDVIEIDAAEYVDDNAFLTANNLTLRGVGGARPHLRSTQLISNGKGIWVNDAQNTTVENIEFSGAAVVDENGAGIRNEVTGLTVCNGYFHDNQNGILGGNGIVLIEYSEFDNNGLCPTGANCGHNIYIDTGTKFTLRYSYTHRAHVGHTVKSRSKETHILYNRITGEDGDTSYEINVPNAGLTFIIGNLIEQGPNTQNRTIILYGEDGIPDARANEIYIVNNTFVNDDPGGGTFVSLVGSPTSRIVNNIFAGPGTKPTASASVTNNLNADSISSAGLVNAAGFDYHLTVGSPARNAGIDPGSAASFSLTPTSQYLHPINRQDRPVDGMIDIGAYEFQ